MAVKGVFKDLSLYPKYDFLKNTIVLLTGVPHIGAHAGGDDFDSTAYEIPKPPESVILKGNPVYDVICASLPDIYLEKELIVQIIQLNGSIIQETATIVPTGSSLIIIPNANIKNGMYILAINSGFDSDRTAFVLMR